MDWHLHVLLKPIVALMSQATNWKQWLGNGRGLVVGKLGGIQKNKWQWRVLNVDGENCTYCDPKPGSKLNTFTLKSATVRMVDNKSAMHKNFASMRIEGSHPEKKTINIKTFIAVLMPKDQKYVFMVEETDSRYWMMVLNQKEFPVPIAKQPIVTNTAAVTPKPAITTTPNPTPVNPTVVRGVPTGAQPTPVVTQLKPVETKPVVTQPVALKPVGVAPVPSGGFPAPQQNNQFNQPQQTKFAPPQQQQQYNAQQGRILKWFSNFH